MKPCDCLTYCGDDPRLREGTVSACAESVAKAERHLRSVERDKLQKELAAQWAMTVTRSHGLQVLDNGHVYIRTSRIPGGTADKADLSKAARYLLLAGLATAHPTRANLLRITEERS